jgi:glycosyltransferase involved in cell wall biosynthesis
MFQNIVLFTANTQGGIIQFTIQLYKTLIGEGCSVKVYMPQNVKESDLSELADDKIFYIKEKNILDNSPYKAIAEKINHSVAELIWYMDDSIVSMKVGMYISGMSQYLTMHDAGNFHPTNRQNLRTLVANKYLKMLANRFYKKVDKFVLLSDESVRTFGSNYPQYSNALLKMNLGAHLPSDAETMPEEMEEQLDVPYYLFFGRIDKYKGINNLLRYYAAAKKCQYHLVIAGSGKMSDEECRLAESDERVVVINRYIKDGEMKWLLHQSVAITLAYIEATQSGVIPLAYYYKKPVLVSDVPGLVQFIDDSKTGFICKNKEEWIHRFEKGNLADYQRMETYIQQYYDANLNWGKNIRTVIDNA